MNSLEKNVAQNFRNQLRGARANALANAEGFDQILFVLERLGGLLKPNPQGAPLGLGKLADELACLARISPLADVPEEHRQFHVPFPILFDIIKDARNDALHEGAVARNLTRNATILALTLEDALNDDMQIAADFMVPGPVCADLWQPISFIRQQMLLHSFSFLPYLVEKQGWRLLSDADVAKFLISAQSKTDRRKRLAMPLAEALQPVNVKIVVASFKLPKAVYSW